MQRIERIKQIFQIFAMNKSTFAVIEPDGNKGQTGDPFKIQAQAAENCLVYRLVPEQVENQKENDAINPVIHLSPVRGRQGGKDTQQLEDRFSGEGFQSPHAEKRYEQSEKNILSLRIEPLSAQHEIKRDLREQGEKEQIPGITGFAGCMQKTFQQEKAEYGESQSANIAEQTVQAIIINLAAHRISEPGSPCLWPGGDKQNTGVINEHDEHGKYLEGTAAEDTVTVFVLGGESV